MSTDHSPPAPPAAPDLAAYETRQAKLYEALAEVQSPSPHAYLTPGEAGMALYHRVLDVNGRHHLEAILTHAHGGEITSGLVPLESLDPPVVQAAQRLTTSLLLGTSVVPVGSQPDQPQKPPLPPPLPLQQESTVESASPERRAGKLTDQDTPIAAASGDPEPVAEDAAHDPEPAAAATATPEEVAAIIARCDALVSEKPEALRLITATFRAHFGLAKNVPFAKALATVDRQAIEWVKAELAKEGA